MKYMKLRNVILLLLAGLVSIGVSLADISTTVTTDGTVQDVFAFVPPAGAHFTAMAPGSIATVADTFKITSNGPFDVTALAEPSGLTTPDGKMTQYDETYHTWTPNRKLQSALTMDFGTVVGLKTLGEISVSILSGTGTEQTPYPFTWKQPVSWQDYPSTNGKKYKLDVVFTASRPIVPSN
jgi:hypothetical protein